MNRYDPHAGPLAGQTSSAADKALDALAGDIAARVKAMVKRLVAEALTGLGEPVTAEPEPEPARLTEMKMLGLALAILRGRSEIKHIRPVPGEELRVIIGSTVSQWVRITQFMHDHPRLSCSLGGHGDFLWYWVAEPTRRDGGDAS